MYTRYAESQGWRVEVMSESPAELGGSSKEIVLRVAGDGAYGQLRFESGGHRVQRVPVTETQGRIHTSAATVAVMPEPDEAQAITPQPGRSAHRHSSAPRVLAASTINKTDSAVRVVHLPTGLMSNARHGCSQYSNKAKALQVLQRRGCRKRSAASALPGRPPRARA